MQNVGFIGLGIMGKSMARNLMKAGFTVHGYARTKAKVEDLIVEGMVFHEDIAGAVQAAEAVITIVGFPADVEDVYFSQGKILDSAKPGTILIDMTTTSPELDIRVGQEAVSRGLRFLDAPVTGGDTGAKAGTLSILVGGNQADYDECMPLFQAMGTNVNLMGGVGAGQHCKLANQILIAGAMSGVCEAFSYAKAKGLDLNTVMDAVATGAAGGKQLDVFGPKIIAGDYAPGFFMKHFIKDMKLAVQESEASGLHLDMLRLVLGEYQKLEAEGNGDLGTQALIKYY